LKEYVPLVVTVTRRVSAAVVVSTLNTPPAYVLRGVTTTMLPEFNPGIETVPKVEVVIASLPV